MLPVLDIGMERESNQMQALCRSGCGFYGNPSTDGLCSLCYKEALKKKQQPPTPTAAPAPSHTPPPLRETATASPTIPVIPPEQKDSNEGETSGGLSGSEAQDGASIGQDADKNDDKDKNKKKNRCFVCRKKVGLTGKLTQCFECRCGGLYCGVHRYSDKHNCTFNYRELGAQEIRRNNPVVVGEKIHKI